MLENELKKLETEYKENQAKLISKYEVLGQLTYDDRYAQPFVHSGSEKRIGTIHFRYQRYESIKKGDQPDVALFRHLFASLPPENRQLVKTQYSTSFTPTEFVKDGKFEDIFPLIVKLEADSSWFATFDWITMISGKLWRIEVEVLYNEVNIGRIYSNTQYYEKKNIIWEIDVRPDAKRIRWSRQDTTSPNRFTVYWPSQPEGGIESIL